MQSPTRLAAIDLGSNSFRLEIGILSHGAFERTEYLKESVRQGAGMDADRNLTPQAMQNGWDCLARFGERLAGFKGHQVRAVATQTLREARNRDVFLARAVKILGFPIDVISGREEARLIYKGVSHLLAPSDERRLVVDIGGRSTELILGQNLQPKVMESYRVGSIAWSTRYFPDGQWRRKSFETAEIAAKAVLEGALQAYQPKHWDVAYGSAGTVSAVSEALVAGGWPDGEVTAEGLDWLLETLIAIGQSEGSKIAGIREDRKAIIGGGLAVTRALFKLLKIERLIPTTGGLRHGLLCQMQGSRESTRDLRSNTVERLANKFNVDRAHGARVSKIASQLLTQILGGHAPDPDDESNRSMRKLRWAAELHEIGSHISHSDYHKHGAYILQNADAMGFALDELQRLSLLVLGHRGKLRKIEADLAVDDFRHQVIALRIAVILCHARRDPIPGCVQLTQGKYAIKLRCDTQWINDFPQSAYLLREEALAWQKTEWPIEFLEN
jgi:exopolyphosphatase/guanosine-5'-triphosphate,3'-diphosphate pyrophosphatase